MKISQGNVRYVGSQVIAGLLENAALPGHDATLKACVRMWFPDAGQVDEQQLRRITDLVRAELLRTRGAVLDRCDRWVAEGKAEAV